MWSYNVLSTAHGTLGLLGWVRGLPRPLLLLLALAWKARAGGRVGRGGLWDGVAGRGVARVATLPPTMANAPR